MRSCYEMDDTYPPAGKPGSAAGRLRYYWADPAWPQIFHVPYGHVFYGQLHQRVGHEPKPSNWAWRDGVSPLPIGICNVCPGGTPHYVDGTCLPTFITVGVSVVSPPMPDFSFTLSGFWNSATRKYPLNILPFGPGMAYWATVTYADPFSTDMIVEFVTPSGVQLVHVPAIMLSGLQFVRVPDYAFDASTTLHSFLGIPLYGLSVYW